MNTKQHNIREVTYMFSEQEVMKALMETYLKGVRGTNYRGSVLQDDGYIGSLVEVHISVQDYNKTEVTE